MENKKLRAQHPKKELAVDILYDIIGSILFGAGIYTFAEGGNFAPGGISGIALIMNKLWNLPVGTMTLILNIPLVIISYKTVGKRFLIKTARTMIISTIFVDLVFPMFPFYTGQASLAGDLLGSIARTWNGSFLYERFFFGWSGFPDNDDQKEETAYVSWAIDAADRPDYYLDRMAGIR